MSSSKLPFVLFFVVILALCAGIFVLTSHKTPQIATQTNSTKQIATPPPSALPTGTSDAQLDEDTQQIDSSLNQLNSDTTAIDQGLNDQQTNLQ